ncbi:ABC transporter ATP-binding protein [Syntrophomonas wolfei]|uniref:ABC transporter ATP-binding protein n=1 Tax=Syntrophomonas wolfei subsp. wolfei (strain DSM 2245B / Goettingen) TaxID=335541 RepID=Q0AVC2_SYNWW|nr:ABC transporter ATP-binding protein [Syntrophomonas wolfei]ABI69332.1 ABC transporter ATP-binding protein [Syntrophomonas wolfei subsp. wolfei str. Goettingen G311]
MIEICGVSKSYNRGQVKAVDDVSLTVQDGEIFGFLGPNGAGKTTLIKMITGILNADRGSIKINGRDIKDSPLEAKMQFSFVPDDPNIFSRLTGIEYLNFMADVYQVSSEIRVERIQKLLERFEMSTAAADLIQSYSHGMKQKIVVIGALLHNPPVWILDEPMTGLDPRSSYDLKEMMREHADAGKTVFFSTHVLEVAEKVCDRLAIINKGRMIFCGSLEEIRTHARENRSLENLFLELTENA